MNAKHIFVKRKHALDDCKHALDDCISSFAPPPRRERENNFKNKLDFIIIFFDFFAYYPRMKSDKILKYIFIKIHNFI